MLGCALALAAGALQAQTATLARSSELRAKPLLNAPVLATLASGAAVELLGNDGGWSRVRTPDGKVGFVRLLNVRVTGAPGAAGGSAVAGLGTLGNVLRTGSTGAVATTGVKGIDKDDIAKSTPNLAEVDIMERYAVSEAEARKAAKSVKLQEQTVLWIGEKP